MQAVLMKSLKLGCEMHDCIKVVKMSPSMFPLGKRKSPRKINSSVSGSLREITPIDSH